MNDTKSISDTLDALIGDVPVSEQLGAALDRMSEREHKHSEYVTREEFEKLNKKLELLFDLVGDTSVSEQINAAISNIKQ